jgi:hypothetical protein
MHPIGGRPWCGRQWRLVRSFVAVREASAIALEARPPVLDFALSIFKYRAQKDNRRNDHAVTVSRFSRNA